MNARHTAVLAALVFAAASCRRHDPETQTEDPRATASSGQAPSATPPADRLAPGELLEGSQLAFGVVLPRLMNVRGSFLRVVYGSAPTSVHALAQYFRARLEDGTFREGPSSATFERVKVRGKPGLELGVRIATSPEGASIEIRDTTPVAAPGLPDEAARWKQVGLTPAGRIADPSHLD